jgi:hypothetical protein
MKAVCDGGANEIGVCWRSFFLSLGRLNNKSVRTCVYSTRQQ